ncbi:MAG: peptide chain release factor-like protein [Candidatus Hydrogenedentes bacterium]|nr:peptide chain release factor-like protein [Candidatus Hydrogenedentota bacterium]
MEPPYYPPPEELEFSFFRSSGPGGQKKNTTDSSVRLRHLPTGLVVVATASRSQHKNRELALEELARRLEVMRRVPKHRTATRPTAAARRRRLESKRIRSRTKQLRSAPPDGE